MNRTMANITLKYEYMIYVPESLLLHSGASCGCVWKWSRSEDGQPLTSTNCQA